MSLKKAFYSLRVQFNYKNCDIFAKICERSSMEEDLEEKALVIIENGGYGNEC
jgi:hypothetical protein